MGLLFHDNASRLNGVISTSSNTTVFGLWKFLPLAHGPWTWRKLLTLRTQSKPFIKRIIGDCSSTFFWHDDWHPARPLLDHCWFRFVMVFAFLASLWRLRCLASSIMKSGLGRCSLSLFILILQIQIFLILSVGLVPFIQVRSLLYLGSPKDLLTCCHLA